HRATKEYIEDAEEFINEIDDEAKRLRYELALLADLAKPTTTIDPNAFAESNLDPEDRDEFVNRFRNEDGNAPAIEKDTKLVRARLHGALIVYDNGLRLMGPRDAVAESVEVGDSETVISAQIKRIGRAQQ